MNKKLWITFVGLSVVLTVLLYLLHSHIVSQNELIIPLSRIYIFNLLVNSMVYSSVYYTSQFAPDKVGYAFMAISVLKILASILFLTPLFYSENKELTLEVVNFFIPYFIFLTLEILFSLKVLQYQTNSE